MLKRLLLCLAIVVPAGCDRTASPPTSGSVSPSATSSAGTVAVPSIRTPDELHAALKTKNPNYNAAVVQLQWDGSSLVMFDARNAGLVDLSPLSGSPLVELYVEENPITDLSPLKGLRLAALSLNDTPVADLSPLRGMPLQQLRLANTKVRDLSPLRGSPLRELWLNNTPVEDLGPLAGTPLVSLTIEGTRVRDLEIVRRLSLLERLNLAGTPADDLSPVAGLRLSRLVFTPSRVTKGIDAARSLPVCREMGPSLEQMSPPQAFWAAYDSGAFR